jgi:hypothetical protein
MAGVQIIASAWFVLRNTAELDLDNASERTCFPFPAPLPCFVRDVVMLTDSALYIIREVGSHFSHDRQSCQVLASLHLLRTSRSEWKLFAVELSAYDSPSLTLNFLEHISHLPFPNLSSFFLKPFLLECMSRDSASKESLSQCNISFIPKLLLTMTFLSLPNPAGLEPNPNPLQIHTNYFKIHLKAFQIVASLTDCNTLTLSNAQLSEQQVIPLCNSS